MAVLGPGQLLGYMSALEKGVHGADAVVREQAVLLEIPGRDFDKLYFGSSPASTKLHRVIQRSLLSSLGQTNRHLSRLISQARLRGAHEEGDAAGSRSQRPDHRRRNLGDPQYQEPDDCGRCQDSRGIRAVDQS